MKFIGNKDMTANLVRIRTYNSIMCEYFCIAFIEYMSKVNFKKNDKIRYNYFL